VQTDLLNSNNEPVPCPSRIISETIKVMGTDAQEVVVSEPNAAEQCRQMRAHL